MKPAVYSYTVPYILQVDIETEYLCHHIKIMDNWMNQYTLNNPFKQYIFSYCFIVKCMSGHQYQTGYRLYEYLYYSNITAKNIDIVPLLSFDINLNVKSLYFIVKCICGHQYQTGYRLYEYLYCSNIIAKNIDIVPLLCKF